MNRKVIEMDGTPVYFIDDIDSGDEQSDPELYSSSSTASGSAETLASTQVHDHHRVMKMLLGSNYWGPVQQVLAPTPGEIERKKVLDIITVEGSWVQEMALQFPDVDFLSVDNVPLMPHVPRPNIIFEVYNLYNGIAAPDESFDIVHMRQTNAHLRNAKDIIRDVHRVLKPGGLLLFGDSELDVFDGLNPEFPAGDKLPGLSAGFKLVRQGFAQQGVHISLWHDLPKLLSPGSDLWVSRRGMSPGFRDIQMKSHILPANTWPEDPQLKELGKLAGHTWKSMWRSMEIPFQMFGMEQEQAKQVVQAAVDDIDRTDIAVAAKYYTIYAFKI
ncbi:hypothetical protein FRC07_010628 [Ceratobasidium sp. 392]|nr:hypothetical protein FRC07_010628 [Ceratobasidium sp. 392]